MGDGHGEQAFDGSVPSGPCHGYRGAVSPRGVREDGRPESRPVLPMVFSMNTTISSSGSVISASITAMHSGVIAPSHLSRSKVLFCSSKLRRSDARFPDYKINRVVLLP